MQVFLLMCWACLYGRLSLLPGSSPPEGLYTGGKQSRVGEAEVLKFLLTRGADGNVFKRAPVPDAKETLSPNAHINDILAELLPAEKHLQAGYLQGFAVLYPSCDVAQQVYLMSMQLCTVVRA